MEKDGQPMVNTSGKILVYIRQNAARTADRRTCMWISLHIINSHISMSQVVNVKYRHSLYTQKHTNNLGQLREQVFMYRDLLLFKDYFSCENIYIYKLLHIDCSTLLMCRITILHHITAE